jgi:hypothetical protein
VASEADVAHWKDAEKRVAALQKENARLKGVCDEIQEIVLIYGEQAAEGCVDSPGGLEHMGDVWNLLCKWDAAISKEPPFGGEVQKGLSKEKAKRRNEMWFWSKPVKKQAIQIRADNLNDVRDFLGGEAHRNIEFSINYVQMKVFINTLEGTMRGDLGDWIIRGVYGEFYPCKPDVFAATYKPVEVVDAQ